MRRLIDRILCAARDRILCAVSDRILCAATSIGDHVMFQNVYSLLQKERVLNSPENMQFWQIAQPWDVYVLHAHICIYTDIYIYVYIYTHIYIYTYLSIYIHIY